MLVILFNHAAIEQPFMTVLLFFIIFFPQEEKSAPCLRPAQPSTSSEHVRHHGKLPSLQNVGLRVFFSKRRRSTDGEHEHVSFQGAPTGKLNKSTSVFNTQQLQRETHTGTPLFWSDLHQTTSEWLLQITWHTPISVRKELTFLWKAEVWTDNIY